MALPDKRLPLIHYDTKDEYEAKVAAMTTEERAQYDAFYLGFVADTREFHTKGNTYKCGRGWVLSDITGAQAGANEFVSNVCAGDTLLMSNDELVLLMGKTLNNNIITVTALSPSGGYSLTFSTDDNGANWHLSATTPRSFVQAELMYGTSAMMAEMGGICETESGCVIAFPSSSQEVKDFADYTLQVEIDDLPDIRRGANKGTQAMAAIESGNLTARDLVGRAEPTIEEFSFRASAGNKSIKDESAVIRRILGNTLYTNGQYRGMSISAIKTVGFNIINTATAISGVFDSSGAIVPNDHYSIATARVLPGEAYYFRRVCNGNYYPTYVVYDANGAVLNVGRLTSSGSNASGYVTMPNNAYSVKIAYNNANVNECCANISHTGIRDGEYEPYKEHTLYIPEVHNYFPEGMWGFDVITDEITPTEAIKRVGHIDLGSLEYTYNEEVQAFEAYIPDIALNTYRIHSSIYDYGDVTEDNIGDDNMMSCVGRYMLFRDSSFVDDTEGFRAAMSGEMLHYELEKPVITKISTPLQLSYWVEDFGTEEALSEGASAPFKAEIVYQFNAVDRIRDNERNILRLEQYLNSKNNITAQPYIVKSGIAANGGKVSDNAASIKALRGDTVVWNQGFKGVNTRIQYGYQTSSNGTTITITNVSATTPDYGNMADFVDFTIKSGHRYLAITDSSLDLYVNSLIGFTFRVNAISDIAPDLNYEAVWLRTETNIPLLVGESESFDFEIIDLTLMFGAGNEPTTVEEYYERKPIVADESAYNEGQLASFGPEWGVRCSVGGSNLVWKQELGSTWGVNSGDLTVNGDSLIVTATGAWPSLYTVAPFKQGHKYLVVCGIQSPLTDTVVIGTPNNGNAQYREVVQANTDTTIVAFLDCTESYNEFYIYPNWNVAASGEEFAITRPQRYDLTETFGAGNEPTTIDELRQHLPRITSTKHFDISSIFPYGLNKVGSVRDEMYYDSARRTWVAVHRLGVVDLGTLEWSMQADSNVFTTTIEGIAPADTHEKRQNGILCEKYGIAPSTSVDTSMQDGSMLRFYSGVAIRDTSFPSSADFTTAMQGVLLCYELAEPVIEDVPFFDSFYNAYEGGTEEIVADTPTTAMDADIAYQYDEQGRIDYVYSKINNL